MSLLHVFTKWRNRQLKLDKPIEAEFKLQDETKREDEPVIQDPPLLEAISDYPKWTTKATIYIEKLRKSGSSEAACRVNLLSFIPDIKQFQDQDSPEDILKALEFSYKHCIFEKCSQGPIYDRDICQFSCCEGCRSVRIALNSLAGELSTKQLKPADILVHKKRDNLQFERGGMHSLIVSIRWVDVIGNSNEQFFNMTMGRDEMDYIGDVFHSLSEEKLELASGWFQECRKGHDCRDNVSFSPRRLIFVGDEDQRPRLVETNSSTTNQQFEYAALSYCWGVGHRTLTTTSHNIEENKRGIPLGKFPKTTQDAIHICRRLGLSYLWVDALCIIQDTDHADWNEQSGQMRHIYSNAQITITADDTPDCAVGFWHWSAHGFRRISRGCWVREAPEQAKDILSTRGWALQERILSHRILHISNTGINWECDECSRYEDGKAKIDFMGLSFRAFRLLNRFRRHENLGTCKLDDDEEGVPTTHITDFLTSGSWKSIYFAWASIIESYSERKLTVPHDKLSAISGLASFVLEHRGLEADSYLAGLWKENLIEDLLWYASKPMVAAPGSTYIAPTWSWASLTGSIKYFRERYQFLFQPYIVIRHASCTASRSDPTGRVTSGIIRVTGELAQVDLVVIPYSNGCHSIYGNSEGCTIREDQVPLAFIRLCHFQGEVLRESSLWYEIMCDEEMAQIPPDPDHEHNYQCVSDKANTKLCSIQTIQNTQSKYFCLSIGEMVDSFTGGRRHWFLVLRQVPESYETYRRVGIGYFQYLRRPFSLFDYSNMRDISLV